MRRAVRSGSLVIREEGQDIVCVRRLMAFEAETRQRFEAIEHKAGEQDAWIGYLHQAIEDLLKPPDVEPKRVGFRPNET